MPKRKDYKSLLLNKIAEDDGLIISKLDNLKITTRITFKCKCGLIYDKSIQMIIQNSGFKCKKCTEKNKLQKMENTNMKRYGVKNASQSEKIKQKKITTSLKKYSVSHTIISKNVKEKTKKTNLEKYGVINPFQSEEIKRKIIETNMKNLNVKYPSQSKKKKHINIKLWSNKSNTI